MSPNHALPFPRGGTASDFGQITGSDTMWSHLEGRVYKVPDTQHGTGQDVYLRAVKNDSASVLTVARKFCRWSLTSDYDFGRRVAGYVNSAGLSCKPIDDAYAAGLEIPAYDIFYVIEGGPCLVQTEATAVDLEAGDAVASDASGLINGDPCAQATEYAVGTVYSDCTTAGALVAIHVYKGLKQIGT